MTNIIPYYPSTYINKEFINTKWGYFKQLSVKYMMVDDKQFNSFSVTLAVNNEEGITESSTFLIKNSFRNFHDQYEQYNTVTQMMYDHMIINKSDDEDIIDEEVVLFTSEFSGVNFGHDMSVILYYLDNYLKEKMTCKIVMACKHKIIPRTI
jgi:hypothetical protein